MSNSENNLITFGHEPKNYIGIYKADRVIDDMTAEVSVEERWLAQQSEFTRALIRLSNNTWAKGLTLIALGIVLGFAARGEISTTAGIDVFYERFLSTLGGLDTGPTTLKGFSETLEALSILATQAGAGWIVLGEGFQHLWANKQMIKEGIASLPKEGKNAWKNHLVVIDPERLLFDALENLSFKNNPEDQVALVHDGGLMNDNNELKGGSIGDSRYRRHMNSWGIDYLSDPNFLSRLNLDKSSKVIFNLWRPDQALYSAIFSNDDAIRLGPAKVANILRTTQDNYQNVNAIVVLPQGMKWDDGDAQKLFKKDRFNKLKSLDVISPEQVVVKRISELFESEKIKIISNIQNLKDSENKGKTLEDVFESDLTNNGVNITKSISDAEVVFVYYNHDDDGIEKAANLAKEYPEKHIITLIERKHNIDEGVSASGETWLIPEIISNKLINN